MRPNYNLDSTLGSDFSPAVWFLKVICIGLLVFPTVDLCFVKQAPVIVLNAFIIVTATIGILASRHFHDRDLHHWLTVSLIISMTGLAVWIVYGMIEYHLSGNDLLWSLLSFIAASISLGLDISIQKTVSQYDTINSTKDQETNAHFGGRINE